MISGGAYDVAQTSILKSQNVISEDSKLQDLPPAIFWVFSELNFLISINI